MITVGHAVAEVAIVAALAVGLSELLQQEFVVAIIGLLGGIFLLWMGYDSVTSAWRGSISLNSVNGRAQGITGLGSIPAGILTSIANPYWFLWWATVGASYVLLSLEHGSAGLVAFYSGHILSDLSWNSLLALVVASGRRVMRDRAYRTMIFVCGLFLLGLSIYFLITGIRLLV